MSSEVQGMAFCVHWWALLRRHAGEHWRYLHWLAAGCDSIGGVPHLVKRRVVADYARRHRLHVFVETGTLGGDMVWAMRNRFDRLYTIELSQLYYEKSLQRLCGWKTIESIYGDSSRLLPEVLKGVDQPVLFWLDAHWSGGETARGKTQTPIMQELDCILNHPVSGHVVLIDDARMFTGRDDYPELEKLRSRVGEDSPEALFEVRDDIIRIVLPS